MNKKGEMSGLAPILLVFITVIVGLALVATIAQNIGGVTSTFDNTNDTHTWLNENSTSNLDGQAVSDVTIFIATGSGNITVDAANYTTSDNQVVDGALTATLTTYNITIQDGNSSWITYTYEPDGYLDSTGRAIAPLILIFFVLGIAVVALTPTMRGKLLELVGK